MAPIQAPKKITPSVPRQRTYARIPKGPRLYTKPVQKVEFPGEPPPGFLAGELHGSRSEWPIFAGLAAAIGPRDWDYRQPPFAGAPDGSFTYQAWQLGGRSKSGGAVVDFLVRGGDRGPDLGIRVQSFRYHLSAAPAIIDSDELQKMRLQRDMNIIDVYEPDFLPLRSSDLVIYIKRVLGLIQNVDPISAGTVRPNR